MRNLQDTPIDPGRFLNLSKNIAVPIGYGKEYHVRKTRNLSSRSHTRRNQ
jgi:hypothetical protein